MSDFERPTVKVHFPEGVRDYPAEYEDQDRIRPFKHRPSLMRKLMPVYNDNYEFAELFGGEFVAVPKMRVTT